MLIILNMSAFDFYNFSLLCEGKYLILRVCSYLLTKCESKMFLFISDEWLTGNALPKKTFV